MKRYFWNLLVSVDQLINTVLGGYPDETLSSRMGKKIIENQYSFPSCWICKFLDLFEKDHCRKRIEADEGEKIDIK